MGAIDAEVMLDSTLLLTSKEWDKLIPKTISYNLDANKYIFFYTIGYSENEKKMVLFLSEYYHLPIVISQYLHCTEIFEHRYKKVVKSGPKEFLWLVKNAKFVFSTSFHGTVFSIIFEKNFLSYIGRRDERKLSLLTSFGLIEHAIMENDNIEVKVKNLHDIDWNNIRGILRNKKKHVDETFEKLLNESSRINY